MYTAYQRYQVVHAHIEAASVTGPDALYQDGLSVYNARSTAYWLHKLFKYCVLPPYITFVFLDVEVARLFVSSTRAFTYFKCSSSNDLFRSCSSRKG